MLQGHALIIGPGETLYNYGYYLFEFNFSKKYPFEPPKVVYLTNEHEIRFHPNLYRNGKVCLSLLNTWRGEQWTSCQTIRTILLNLVTLFHNKPLLNEPGIKEDYKYFKDYNRMIKFSNYNTAVLSVLKEKIYKTISQKFSETFKEKYLKNKDKILEHLKQLKENEKVETVSIGIYSRMTCNIDYNKLYDLFVEYNTSL